MTLKLTTINHGELCHVFDWTITDEEGLAKRVARVAPGQYRHVQKILDGKASMPEPKASANQIAAATKLLTGRRTT